MLSYYAFALQDVELSPEGIKAFLSSFGWVAAVIYIFLFSIKPFTPLPGSMLGIAGGLTFGPILGTVYTVIGATIGSTLAFLYARYFAKDLIREDQEGWLAKVSLKLKENTFVGVLSMRLNPLFPFDFVSYASGILGVRTDHYVLATAIGIIPGTFAFVFLGDSLTHGYRIWLALGLLALLSVLPWVLFRKKEGEKEE